MKGIFRHVVTFAQTGWGYRNGRMSAPQTFTSLPYPNNRSEQNFNSHQWPWRVLAFASDLGSIGYLLKKPKLGTIGWLIAIPYYAYSILQKPDFSEKKKEFLYQVTANGLFPFLEAKLGIGLGQLAHTLFKDSTVKTLSKNGPNTFKIAGGIVGVALLTPTIGDPLAQKVLNPFMKP